MNPFLIILAKVLFVNKYVTLFFPVVRMWRCTTFALHSCSEFCDFSKHGDFNGKCLITISTTTTNYKHRQWRWLRSLMRAQLLVKPSDFTLRLSWIFLHLSFFFSYSLIVFKECVDDCRGPVSWICSSTITY